MKYAVNEEGVQALKGVTQKLEESVILISNAASSLGSVAEEHLNALGPHHATIVQVLEDIRKIAEAASEPIENISELLNDVAEAYQEVIDNDRFNSSSLGTSVAGAAAGVAVGATVAAAAAGSQKDSLLGAIGKMTSGTNGAKNSGEYNAIVDALEKAGVAFRPIALASEKRTPDEIVKRLSGGDLTEGSCSSLALAYAGNRAGYDVLDFRDGESRSFFSSRSSIQKIADLPGVESIVFHGTDEIECANQLLSLMGNGKEYYLATGQHAAIVRKNGDKHEYLELQHPSNGNGWHKLDDNVLRTRFICRCPRATPTSNFLIEVESLSRSREFLRILGFINTAASEERKGRTGNVR